MPTLLAFVAGGLALVALALAFYQVAQKLGELESAARRVSDQAPPETGRRPSGGRPMLSALYQEAPPSPLDSVNRLPGGRWLVAASVLALASLLIAFTTRSGGSAPKPVAPDTTVAMLTRRVDSLAAGIVVLRDSIRVLAVERPAARTAVPAPATRIARRSPAKVDGLVPPAPVPPFGTAP